MSLFLVFCLLGDVAEEVGMGDASSVICDFKLGFGGEDELSDVPSCVCGCIS